MPKRKRLFGFSVALLAACCAAWSQAAQQALLVGVGDYPGTRMDLHGPRHDVAALQDYLVERLGFAANRIDTLVDSEATHGNVLRALAKVGSVTASGDFVLVYFSGHGTSVFDADAGLPLAHDTGAFVPVDYAVHGTPQEKLASLIIGSRDLRPTFTAIDDKGASGLILVDACYSANTSRSLHAGSRPVYRNIESGLSFLDAPRTIAAQAREAYPYRNLATLAASSAKEKAIDLNDPGRTLDGKPHGAFTDALLRALRTLPGADVNGDVAVSNWELYQRVRAHMSDANIPHSPQFLPMPHQDQHGLGQAVAFRADAAVAPSPPPTDQLVVRLEGDLPLVEAAVAATDALQLARTTKAPHNLLVTRQRDIYRILTPFGDAVASFGEQVQAAAALRQQPWIRRLVRQLDATPQAFALSLRLRGETFEEGEQLALSAVPAQSAHLLVLDIVPDGTLRLLFPSRSEEFGVVSPDRPARFEVRVTPPFGVDHVVVAAFAEPLEFYDDRLLATDQIAPTTALHSALVAFLGGRSHTAVPRTFAVRKVVTVPSSENTG